MRKRILIVDDHVETRQAARRLLAEHSEWEICGEADNGLGAVEKAATLKPDIVILDLSMPKMNGFEAAKIIHTADPKLPLLLFSINGGDAQALDEVRAAGFRGAVSKATAWLLPEAVELLLQGKTFLGGAALTVPVVEIEAAGSPRPADEPRSAQKADAGPDDPPTTPVA
jgi:DNA-binding NarL/FixJ family response regulator